MSKVMLVRMEDIQGTKMWGRMVNGRSFIVTKEGDGYVASFKDTPSMRAVFFGTFETLDEAAAACAENLRPVN